MSRVPLRRRSFEDARAPSLAACPRHAWLVRQRRLTNHLLIAKFLERHDRAVERNRNHVIHRLDEMKLHLLADVGRDLLEIALVIRGENDASDAGARRGEDLVLHAADRKYFAAQSDLAGHGDVAM